MADETPAAGPAGPEPAVPELPGARGVALERVPIRKRESGATLSAWRLAVSSDRGDGAILLVEGGEGGPFHRGEGVFLGWEQDRLASAYAALRPNTDEPPLEMLQMG